jgi:clan AA aspartic protease
VRGSVTSDGREASVLLEIESTGFGPNSTNVRAVIDTGFTSHLTLPPEVVRSLSLPERGFVEVELADGGIATLVVYEARILWHGQPRRVPVYETDGGPLLGMSLLSGSTLTIEVVPNGEVTIAEKSQEFGT